MAERIGTPLQGPVRIKSTLTPKPIAYSNEIAGGPWNVNTIAERNAIQSYYRVDDAGNPLWGSTCYVHSDPNPDNNGRYELARGLVDSNINNNDNWQKIAAGATSIAASVVKQLYESNNNTNAFTDSEKAKLALQSGTNTGDESPGSVRSKLLQNPNTEIYTTAEKNKLSLQSGSNTGDETDQSILGKLLNNANVNVLTDAEKQRLNDIQGVNTGDETPETVLTKFLANENTEQFTTEHRTKLEGLEDSKFRGKFTSLTELQTAYPVGQPGWNAYVDAGVGNPIVEYIWDDTDDAWELQEGTATAETPESIKTKYESNANTNAYDDASKAKVDNLSGINTGDETPAEIKSKLLQNPDTNNFGNNELSKLNSALQSLQEGEGISIDFTNPTSPKIHNAHLSLKPFAKIQEDGSVTYWDSPEEALEDSYSNDNVDVPEIIAFSNDYGNISVPIMGPKTLNLNGFTVGNVTLMPGNNVNLIPTITGNGTIAGVLNVEGGAYKLNVNIENQNGNGLVITSGSVAFHGDILTSGICISATPGNDIEGTVYGNLISYENEAITSSSSLQLTVHGDVMSYSDSKSTVSLQSSSGGGLLKVYGNIALSNSTSAQSVISLSEQVDIELTGAILNKGTGYAIGQSIFNSLQKNIRFLGRRVMQGSVQATVSGTPTNIIVTSIEGEEGSGVPSGGTEGQALVKLSNQDYDAGWSDVAWGDHTAEITALQQGKVDKYITVPNTFEPGDVLGFNSNGDFTIAGTNVEMFALVVQEGKAILPGQSYDLGLPVGGYFYNETTQELTLTQPTAEGEVVRPAYIQGNGFGVFLYSQGYQMAGELDIDVDESVLGSEYFDI